MKKNLTLVSLMLGVMLLASLSAVSADKYLDIKDVDLNGVNQVTVAPSASITASVEVKAHNQWWSSTRYKIGDGSWSSCVNTGNHYDSTNTESFGITAPSSIGTYDFAVKVYEYEGCNDDDDYSELKDGIIVVAPEPDCQVIVDEPSSYEWYNNTFYTEWHYEGDCNILKQEIYLHDNNNDVDVRIEEITNDVVMSLMVNPFDIEHPLYPEENPEGNDFSICVDSEASNYDGEIYGCSTSFGIDLTPPVAEANGPYECDEGSFVTFDASGSYDDLGWQPSGIDTLDWYVDGSYVGSGWTYDYYCQDGDDFSDVELIATDHAGNVGTDDTSVTINNVAPNCYIDEAPTDTPTGYETDNFVGHGTDPAGIEPYDTLSYMWDFGDGNSASGTSATNTYNAAGTYTVTLTVSDEDGGVNDSCTTEIKVITPTPLTDQEVAAFYPLVADFGEEDPNPLFQSFQFHHGITGFGDCQKYDGPANLGIEDDGGWACGVHWSKDAEGPFFGGTANPTNDERGNHFVLVRVTNGTDAEYYSFNIMVYSWIIPLEEGWNLISIPLVAEDDSRNYDPSIENVFLNPLSGELPGGSEYVVYSYQYDGTSSDWLKSRSSGYGDLDTVSPGYGYWIKVSQDTELKGMGKESNVAETLPVVQIPVGSWALIGRYGILGRDWTPGDSLDERTHGPLDKSVALSSINNNPNELHVWDSDGNGNVWAVNDLYNNEGYWMRADNGNKDYAPTDNSGEYYTYHEI